MSSPELLPEIGLLPPPMHTPWAGLATAEMIHREQDHREQNQAPEGDGSWPLFWYDPPWHFVSPEVVRQIVAAVDAMKIPVAALGRDMGEENIGDMLLAHTLTPYRPDRYGLHIHDLQAAQVVDVRLARARDELGRYAYAPAQLERWLGLPVENGLPAPAPGWLPELCDVGALAGKLAQLRTLRPQVRCAVSITPYRLQQELPGILAARPEVIILRMDDADELQGIRLAATVVTARSMIRTHGRHAELWVVPPDHPSADDCVKLYALGAAAVAIDWWCQPMISQAVRGGGQLAAEDAATNPYRASAHELLHKRRERIAGLVHSCGVSNISELSPKHLVTASPTVAKRLGISR